MSYANNKRAHFDYEILETIEGGLVLLGTEVKSIRAGRAKLDGGYVVVRGGEAYLVGASIPAWQPVNASKSYDPERPRKLLLKEKELLKVTRDTDKQGLTAVALSLYNSGRNIKLSFGIAKGKKKADKRESLKARDVKREIERTLKSQ
ncbi:MAG: SsrA-binding protein SmpB [Candidatus Pacebacteria bacterium]|jgi:SsrA-binding protein|nr:SsrA-binding protein SmpB [Candidatus Paceibacterota bacterium]